MKDFAQQLARRHSLALARQREASEIVVSKGELTFEITIPDTVLEWFVVARHNESIVWEDWCDYYPLSKETPAQLGNGMRTDLESFVAALVGGAFRASSGRLERREVDEWSAFNIGAAT